MTTATTTATKISVSHLYKRYGSHQVIDDVSFDVQEGQVTLLAGPNGAGKSTLLRMICGLDTIDKGDITIMGQHYSQLSDPKHTIGALLDATWLDTALTAEQNLRVLADLAGIHRRRVANCLEMCGLTSVAGRKVSDFSLGMRQRCGIAAALLGDPELLILDEPVNGLDPAGMRWLNDLLESHTQAGGTTLLSSHFLADSELIASRVVILGKAKPCGKGRSPNSPEAPGILCLLPTPMISLRPNCMRCTRAWRSPHWPMEKFRSMCPQRMCLSLRELPRWI